MHLLKETKLVLQEVFEVWGNALPQDQVTNKHSSSLNVLPP